MFTCSGRAYTIEHASRDKTKHYREMACIGLAITCVHWLGLWLCGKACSAPSASILCILTTGWWKIHLYGINTQIGHLKHSNWHPKTVLAGRSLISFHGDIQPGHMFSHHSSLILVSLDGTYLSLVSICKHNVSIQHHQSFTSDFFALGYINVRITSASQSAYSHRLSTTVDGWSPAPVEVGSLSHYFHGLCIPGGAGFLPSMTGLQWF